MPQYTINMGVTANATSAGQKPRIDQPTICGVTITNQSSGSIQYTINGGGAWTNIAAGASATPTVPVLSQFLLRKVAGDSYPANVKIVYTGSAEMANGLFTVATLPAAGEMGRRAFVKDATTPAFLGTLTGGGAVVCPVFDNGTAWVVG